LILLFGKYRHSGRNISERQSDPNIILKFSPFNDLGKKFYILSFVLENTKPVIMNDNTFLPKLSQNLLEILEDNEYYDITIEVGNDPYVKIFRAHMVILNYRSPYLRRILSTNNKKKNDGNLAHIKLPYILH